MTFFVGVLVGLAIAGLIVFVRGRGAGVTGAHRSGRHVPGGARDATTSATQEFATKRSGSTFGPLG